MLKRLTIVLWIMAIGMSVLILISDSGAWYLSAIIILFVWAFQFIFTGTANPIELFDP